MKDNGVRPEIEVFDLSHIHGARRLVDRASWTSGRTCSSSWA